MLISDFLEIECVIDAGIQKATRLKCLNASHPHNTNTRHTSHAKVPALKVTSVVTRVLQEGQVARPGEHRSSAS